MFLRKHTFLAKSFKSEDVSKTCTLKNNKFSGNAIKNSRAKFSNGIRLCSTYIYVDFPYDITILQSSRVSIRLYVRTTASLSVQCYFFLNI